MSGGPACHCLIASSGWTSMMMFKVRLSRMCRAITNSNNSARATVAATGKPLRQQKAADHRQIVGHRIDDGVAKIIQRDGAGAVAVDDPVGIFNQLPATFDQHRDDQPALPGEARKNQKRRAVKQEAMQHVRQRVPVGDVLRILRALHGAVPEFDITAGADRQPSHRKQDRGLQRKNAGGDQQPVPARKRRWRPERCRCCHWSRSCVADHQQRRAIGSIDHAQLFQIPLSRRREPPARLQGSGSVTMRGAPLLSLTSTKQRINADPWPRSIISGSPMKRSIPRVPWGGLRNPNSTPSGHSTADIRNRLPGRRDDELVHRGLVEIAADEGILLGLDRPTIPGHAAAPSQRRTSGRSADVIGRKA